MVELDHLKFCFLLNYNFFLLKKKNDFTENQKKIIKGYERMKFGDNKICKIK